MAFMFTYGSYNIETSISPATLQYSLSQKDIEKAFYKWEMDVRMRGTGGDNGYESAENIRSNSADNVAKSNTECFLKFLNTDNPL